MSGKIAILNTFEILEKFNIYDTRQIQFFKKIMFDFVFFLIENFSIILRTFEDFTNLQFFSKKKKSCTQKQIENFKA